MRKQNVFKTLLTVLSGALCGACVFTAMSISSVFNAKAEETTDMICAGASVRVTAETEEDGLNGSGIRFHIRMPINDGSIIIDGDSYDKSYINTLITGIQIKPEGKDYIDVDRTNAWVEIQDGEDFYMETKAHVYNITEDYYDKEFTYRGYYEKEDTNERVYTAEDKRSLSYVAMKAKAELSDGEFTGINKLYNEILKGNVALTDKLNSYLPANRTSISTNFDENANFIYRVGNQNEISLDSLFSFNYANEVPVSETTVTFKSIDGVTFNKNEATGKWLFEGTGTITLSLKEEYSRATTELTVEVVDAMNVTTVTNAVDNNVVLLNDVSGSSLTISNGNTFYGNGFKVNFGGDGSYGSAAVSYGFVTISSGGVLDNTQIKCRVFPKSYLYSSEMTKGSDGRYPYGYSAIVITGNSTVSNSYIYGARNNIRIGEGNVTIDNTVMGSGSLSNMYIKSNDNYTVTLRDVTTIQYETTDDFGQSQKVLGFGVLVGDNESESNPTINLEGKLVQYNWVTSANSDVSNTYAKSAINEALKVSTYQHKYDGQTTVNIAIVYLNEVTANINDNRTDKATMPYKLSAITMSGYSGQVYSVSGATNPFYNQEIMSYDSGKGIVVNYEYVPTKHTPILPEIVYSPFDPNPAVEFKHSFNETQGTWTNVLSVDLDNISGGSYLFYFEEITINKYGEDLSFTILDSNGNEVDYSTQITLNSLKTLQYTFVGTDLQGNTFKLPFTIHATKTSIEPPKFVNANTASAIRLVEKAGGDWRPAYTVLTGVTVTYWSESDSKVKTIDLSTIYDKGTINSNVWTYTCNDFTLTITGGAVHSDGTTITPVVSNNTLYFASTNKAFGTSTTSRNIILTYVFTDKNASTTWNRTETVTYGNLSEYSYSSFKNGKLEEPSSGTGCVAAGTLITLADGTQKKVEDVVETDTLLVFDHETGKYVEAGITFIERDGWDYYNVINLEFSNGVMTRLIYEHGLFDLTLNKYVYIDEFNYESFIGHEFAMLGKNGNAYETVTLENAYITNEYTGCYSLVTLYHLNYYIDGLLSMPGGINGLFNYFEFGEDLKYDEEQMQADIDKYGLFTYEDFEAYIPYEIFEYVFPAKYYKVSIAKGLMTWDDIFNMIEIYLIKNGVM